MLLPSALRSYCHDGMRNSLLTAVVCYPDVFTIVRASRTGERLLNPRVQAGFTNVMRHVREGCVSDPDPRQLAMHVVTGRSEDGLLTFRSMRGTTNAENYHKQLKDVVSSARTSPRLAHSVLLAFNAAWNNRMAGENYHIELHTLDCGGRVDCRVAYGLIWVTPAILRRFSVKTKPIPPPCRNLVFPTASHFRWAIISFAGK